MQSLTFTPGRAFLSSDSPVVPWTVVFEDEGIAGYFYACDRSQQNHDHSILDAMLIYNVAALAASDAALCAPVEKPQARRKTSLGQPGGKAARRSISAKAGWFEMLR